MQVEWAIGECMELSEHETHAQKQTLCVERICEESETGRRRPSSHSLAKALKLKRESYLTNRST